MFSGKRQGFFEVDLPPNYAWYVKLKHQDPQRYNRWYAVWCVNFDHSIIVENCKGKQTYLHSLSLKNQTLRHIHSIDYNNTYYLTLNGRRIAIILRLTLLGRVGIKIKLYVPVLKKWALNMVEMRLVTTYTVYNEFYHWINVSNIIIFKHF